jgi:hypothetical protein
MAFLFHVPDSTPAGIGGIDINTVLMMHMDGDQSDSQHLVTHNGDPQFSTVESKFGGSSLFFDGSGDYLTVPPDEDFSFGTGDFTVDCWVNSNVEINTGTSDIREIVCLGTTGVRISYGCGVNSGWGTGIRILAKAQSGDSLSDNISISANTWYHIGIVRASGVMYFYLDGALVSSHAHAYDYDYLGSDFLYIGVEYQGAWPFKGYMDELRISKGIARWASDFSASLPSEPYTPDANTSLLLHFDGDVSTSAHVVTSNGNPQLDPATTKVGFNGSMYFDGGTTLTLPDSSDWDFGNGDFTIDFWVRHTSLTSDTWYTYMAQYEGEDDRSSLSVKYDDVGSTFGLFFRFLVGAAGVIILNSGIPAGISLNIWYHIAVVRYGNEWNLYKDGISVASDTHSITAPTYNGPLYIGNRGTAPSFIGYMDELRISKGIARWTSNFTPEIGPYTT